MKMNKSISRGTSAGGFTLIELLVVIAIIAILAAIIFPVFSSVRERARQASCSSNLKQLGLAFTQYEQDSDEFFPCGTQNSKNSNYVGGGWAGQIYPYVKSVGVYDCPDDPTKAVANGATTYYPVSYAANANINQPNGANVTMPHPPQMLNTMNASASTVLLFEIENNNVELTSSTPERHSISIYGVYMDQCWHVFASFQNTLQPVNNGYAQFAQGAVNGMSVGGAPAVVANGFCVIGNGGASTSSPYHPNGTNWLAADGHVKYLSPSRVSGGIDPGQSGQQESTDFLHATSTDTMKLGTNKGSAPVTLTWAVT